MSADGKIADFTRKAARFGSDNDKAHLEQQVAQADGVLFGAGTLRAYGSTLRVTQPDLQRQRQQQGKPLQPVHIVCSRSGAIDPKLTFFCQPVTRWLLTTPTGAHPWENGDAFERILTPATVAEAIDWQAVLQHLWALGLRHLVVLGGGTIVASLLQAELIDELWLTVCPLVLGGIAAPTPVEGNGLPEALAPQLQLLEARSLGDEVFLHYKVRRA